jgi:hypothetical protein
MSGRNIIYYQTIQDGYSKSVAGSPFTHVYLASIHVHADLSLLLNDWAPDDPRYATLWGTWVPRWKAAGKSVMLLLGGAGNGTWGYIRADLDRTPPNEEPIIVQRLGELLDAKGLDGIDLDIETYDDDIVPLVQAILAAFRQFRPATTITMSPTPDQLDAVNQIQGTTAGLAWANVQMYCWFVDAGDLASTYISYLDQFQNLDPGMLVAGVELELRCCPSSAVLCAYATQIRKLAKAYPDFAGTSMWEYYYVATNPPAAQWPACAAAALNGEACSACGRPDDSE